MLRPTFNFLVQSCLPFLLCLAVVHAASQKRCYGDKWDANTEYCEGKKVYFRGQQYKSKWCNVNLKPSEHDGDFDAWINQGYCIPPHIPPRMLCKGAVWKETEEYCQGTYVYQGFKQYKSKWCNINKPPKSHSEQFDDWEYIGLCLPPSASGEKLASPSAFEECAGVPWDAEWVYNIGDTVYDEGQTYSAKWYSSGEDEKPSTHHGQDDPWTAVNGPCMTPVPSPTRSPPPRPPPADHVIAGYYTDYSVYQPTPFFPKALVDSGTASRISHLIFAFMDVTSDGLCKIPDPNSFSGFGFSPDESVSGEQSYGLFRELQALKERYPDLRILYSVGGYLSSQHFTQVVTDERSIQRFVDSCYDILFDPRWFGLFDGIDIDWEYPNGCGNTCDYSGQEAFGRLMTAMRNKFGTALVTSAISGDGSEGGKIENAGYERAKDVVDFYFVMTYDYFGAFEPDGPTAPHAPLTAFDGIPQEDFYAAAGIQKLIDLNIDPSKLVFGIPFYGRGWAGVTTEAPGGSASGPAPGKEQGVEDYKILMGRCPPNASPANLVGGTSFSFCESLTEWWSFDTVETVTLKMIYAKGKHLGGAFAYEFIGDSSDGELMRAMSDGWLLSPSEIQSCIHDKCSIQKTTM